MHVILMAPHFPANQRQFARALKSVGAQVTGVGEANVHQLDGELRSWLDGYEQVPSVCDNDSLLAAVRRIQRRGWVDRLETTIEAHMIAAAHVRELTGIPGLSNYTTLLCRDKPMMKDYLRKHDISTARSTGADTYEEARVFAEEVGFPLIVKPRAGAGAHDTSRVDNLAQLKEVCVECGLDRGGSVAVEEFIEGHEGFYDTLTVGGEVKYEFISHYFPGVLEAMRTRWISPQIAVTNRIDAPGYTELRKMGRDVIRALGIHTSATHMEWFYGPKGLKFSEIGARLPGVCTWDMYSAANGIDLYREWAMGVVHGKVADKPSRQFSAGMIALRPDRDGHISGYTGAELLGGKIAPYLIDLHLPPVGTRTQPVESGFMANAWVRLRHPDYDGVRELMEFIGNNVKVHAR